MNEQHFLSRPVCEEGKANCELIWFLHGLGDTHHTWDELFIDQLIIPGIKAAKT